MNAKVVQSAQHTSTAKPLFAHQQQTIEKLHKTRILFDQSDAGTGKTRPQVERFAERRRKGGGAAIVTATRSILDAAWKTDFNEFAPDMNVGIAFANNREEVFANTDYDVIVTNHDATKWLAKQKPTFFKRFDTLINDECFPAGTLVDTPNGPTAIEVLKNDDQVYTSSGIKRITRTFVKSSNNLVQMEFSNGQKIICTGNHPFATTEGWMEAWRTGGMSVVRLDIRKLNESRPNVLLQNMRQICNVGDQTTRGAESHWSQISRETTRTPDLEQRGSLPSRNKAEAERGTQGDWTPTEATGRQWADSAVRENDARNASGVLGTAIRNTNWKDKRQWLRALLQSGFRAALQAVGIRSRRKLAHIAQTLGCEERFLSSVVRVVRVSRYECSSPCLVYNLQINGPHTYSIAGGILVHNCTAFKHHTSQRSKAAKKISEYFEYRNNMTGTPMTNGICDIHHQVLLLDGGDRLGKDFEAFRKAACRYIPGEKDSRFGTWVDREGIENTIAALIKDISIRHVFEECMDIPPNLLRPVPYKLPRAHRKLYDELFETKVLELQGQTITAVNGGSFYQKTLQASSGAVYSGPGTYALIDTGRYELILDLVEEREHSIVFFFWDHQLKQLTEEADKRGITYAVYDGQTSDEDRGLIRKDYQAGHYRTIFAHPKTAGHGLTLTRGTRSIFASPTDNLEFFLQGYKRIYRAGQTQKTETLVVIAEGTVDERVYYDILSNKNAKQGDYLKLLRAITKS